LSSLPVTRHVRQLGLISTPLPSGAQLNDGTVNTLCIAIMMVRYLVWRAVFSIVDSMVSRRKRGKTRQLVIPLAKRIRLLKSDNSVRARMPAFGLIGIRMVVIGIRLQTWMRVILGVDVYR
jgi:hypothetical protein